MRRSSSSPSPPASAPTTSTSRRRSTAGVTVTEVTYSNSISVAEHVVMMILGLVRNYIPSYQVVVDGGWNIADCVVPFLRPRRDAGRHGRGRAHRLAPCCGVSSRSTSSSTTQTGIGCPRRSSVSSASRSTSRPRRWCRDCDVVTINAPLHPETENLFDADLIGTMKRGAYLVNTARGKICDRDAVARASRAGSSPATRATSGSRSRRRKTIRGARCPTTA